MPSPIRLFLLVVACALLSVASATETMTLCLNCTRSSQCSLDNDPQSFVVPTGSCYSPTKLFPDDADVWGEGDIRDVCHDLFIERSFFGSVDGSCQGEPTDVYKLEYDTCLGPFGAPRPWGVFSKCY